MSPKILLLILSLSMLLSSVQAVLSVTYAATNPYCAAPGELTLSVKDEDAASQDIEFDAIGTYYDANKESIPLMVKNGNPSGPSDFTFYSYSNNLAGTTARVCSGTATFTFIDLVGSYLFLYDSGSSTYFFCKFNPSASSTPKALSITGLVPKAITQFNPYFADETTLYVLVSDRNNSQVVTYDTTSSADPVVGQKVGNPVEFELATAAGNDKFLYDPTEANFLAYNAAAWATEAVIGSVTGKLVKVYTIRAKHVFIDVLNAAKTESKLYSV